MWLVPIAGAIAPVLSACAGWPDSAQGPNTDVLLNNAYPASAREPLVVYDAFWQVSFAGSPISPGASSAPRQVVPTSGDTAYVLLAPGWDPSSTAPPTSFIVLQSRSSYSLGLGDTLTISVDDTGFEGNCAAGSALTQDQADLLTQIVFAGDFAGLTYDASTCTTSKTAKGDASGDAGGD